MPYVFEETQVGEARPASEFPSLPSEVYTETFAQAFEENPIAAILRAKDLGDDYRSSKRLDFETATQRLKDRGMEGDIKVSEAGIPEDALNTLMFRKGIERRRQEVFSQAEGGLGQGAARLGIALGTGLIDPLNVATAFIPVIGEARYTSLLAKAGSTLGRVGVRAGAGAIEGVAGAALIEPIIAGSRRFEQADYDMADSLLNVAFGGVFGAGLHTTFGAISDGVTHYRGAEPTWKGLEGVAPDEIPLVQNLRQEIARGMDARDVARVTETWSPAARRAVEPDLPKATVAEVAHQTLPPITRELALKQAIVQAASDEPVNVQPIIESAATKQTQTADFQRWVAGSKAVDERGAPVVLYGESSGLSFSDNPRAGQAFYISARNPARDADIRIAQETLQRRQLPAKAAWVASMTATGGVSNAVFPYPENVFSATSPEVIRLLKKRGFDSIRGGDTWTVFDASQIRPAISSPQRFNSDNASDVSKAAKYAQKVIARETDTGTPTADTLKMATDEASLAQTDLKAVADRLGIEMEDAELNEVLEAAARSERWSRAAELATVCLTRGG